MKTATAGLSKPFAPPASGIPASAVRSRSLHWVAWAAALASIVVASLWKWAGLDPRIGAMLQGIDVALAMFFAVEFFTRTGWTRSRLAYVKWRWFDFVALVPITTLAAFAAAPVFWIVMACRVIRLLDRTLGDGFVQRNLLVAVGAVEEEITDRVVEKILVRWEHELKGADFGAAMAQALDRNKNAVLRRLYADQFGEGAFAKVARVTGLRAGLEKQERQWFGAMIEIVGSREVDDAIRDVVASSLRKARQQLGANDWRRRLGTGSPATVPLPLVFPTRKRRFHAWRA